MRDIYTTFTFRCADRQCTNHCKVTCFYPLGKIMGKIFNAGHKSGWHIRPLLVEYILKIVRIGAVTMVLFPRPTRAGLCCVMPLCAVLLSLAFPCTLYAQYSDDFSDGEWQDRWELHTGRFRYDHSLGELLYDAPETNGASLVHASAALDSAVWEIELRYGTTDDGSNFFRFYLASVSTLFTTGEEAFYAQCADVSGRVSLAYQKDGEERVLLMTEPVKSGDDGITSLKIRVERECDGRWSLLCDAGGVHYDGGTAVFPSTFASVASGFRVRMGAESQYLIAVKSVIVDGKARCGDDDEPDGEEDRPDGAGSSPHRHGVVFTEIMADPSPAVALPEVEYVEVYNRSDSVADLSGYLLFVGDNYGTVQRGTLLPGEYAILCAAADSSAMSACGKVLPVKNFRALINEGRVTYLADAEGNVVTWIDYSDEWYGRDRFKRDGGWSLERHDVDNLRCDSTLWSPSVDLSGGTPGRPNSVARLQPDTLPAHLLSVGIPADTLIVLLYDKELDASSGPQIEAEGLTVTDVYTEEPKRNSINVVLQEPMDEGEVYTLSVSGVRDVSGLAVADTVVRIAVPSVPEAYDVVINEVMPRPAAGAPKYIELYNRSGKVVDLSDLYLARYDDDGYLSDYYAITSQPSLMFPCQYAVLTPDVSSLRVHHNVCDSALCVQTDVPLAAADGDFALILRNGTVIDALAYSEDWHHPWIDSTEGVALERIDTERFDESGENWRSAASSAGYATPGCPNSHSLTQPDAADGADKQFWLTREAFTPDNDGFEDMLEICYALPRDGYLCSVSVYSPNGERIGMVSERGLLPASGRIVWDGTVDGRLLAVGIYVLLVEAVHPDGDMVSRKLVAVLSAR